MNKFLSVFVLACVLISPVWASDAQVDINHADAQLLADSLHGVGLKKAQAIVAWRNANGEFASAQQLTEVKGIGESLLAKNKERIVLE
jgi:competence protein ComEA